jgi:sterol desaturase/sphingolipid hydroxylase (fatty acid hydroxylase superfamily)
MLSEWIALWIDRFLVPIDDPGSRLFHVNILFAALFAAGWVLFSGSSHKQPPQAFLRTLTRLFFRKRYWWNASTRIDYQIYVLNGLLKVFVFIPFLEFSYRISQWTISSLLWMKGDFAGFHPGYLAITAFTVAAFVFDDFLRFFHHQLMHRVPILWRFHQLHHSAHVLTPITLFRSHPVESAMATIRNSLSLGVATGCFIFLFESRFGLLTILGVNAFGFLFNLLGSNLRHSHVPVSFGWLENVFISPKQHQIHHSSQSEHFNRNFGVSLSIWDRLAGSLLHSDRVQSPLKFGSGRSARASLLDHLIEPFRISKKSP